MECAAILVAAYAEENRRLLQLTTRFPLELRDVPGPDNRLSLKQTLGHLAFWDDYAVRFHVNRRAGESQQPLTMDEFEDRNRQVLELICNDPFEDVLATYREATRMISAFLTERWDELDDDERENFRIPLKHRRHHRRRLSKLLESLGITPDADAAGMTVRAC